MVCPFLCVVITPVGFGRWGWVFLFFSVNRLLLSPGAKRDFRSSGKSLYDVAILFYGADSAAAACAFFFARYSRALIRSYPAPFQDFSPGILLNSCGGRRGSFPFSCFFDFLTHLPDFLLCQLCKLCQFIFKSADMFKIYPDMLNSLFRPFSCHAHALNPADKLVEGSRGKVG